MVLLICYDGDFPEMIRACENLGCSIVFRMDNRGSREHVEVKELSCRNPMIIASSCYYGLDESESIYRGGVTLLMLIEVCYQNSGMRQA